MADALSKLSDEKLIEARAKLSKIIELFCHIRLLTNVPGKVKVEATPELIDVVSILMGMDVNMHTRMYTIMGTVIGHEAREHFCKCMRGDMSVPHKEYPEAPGEDNRFATIGTSPDDAWSEWVSAEWTAYPEVYGGAVMHIGKDSSGYQYFVKNVEQLMWFRDRIDDIMLGRGLLNYPTAV